MTSPRHWSNQPIPATDGANLIVRADLDAGMLGRARLTALVFEPPAMNAGARSRTSTIGDHDQ
jgi:hypothetical protein